MGFSRDSANTCNLNKLLFKAMLYMKISHLKPQLNKIQQTIIIINRKGYYLLFSPEYYMEQFDFLIKQ